MLIFYDFETSSRHLLGQVISYAFVLTNNRYEPIDTCKGFVKLNRIQCPEVGAILTNKCDIDYLQEHGETEYDTAHKIRDFIQGIVTKYGSATLVGFNSNSFDLSFLRTMMIRYGLNPYFMGKLKNLDVLHWAQYLAFYQSDKFLWVLKNAESSSYYSFRLEDLARVAGILTEEQSHDALDDVLLTIRLIQYFEQLFEESFQQFEPLQVPLMEASQQTHSLFKQRRRDFVELGETPKKFTEDYFLSLSMSDKQYLFVDVQKYKKLETNASEEEKLSCMRYINANKAFFICERLNDDEQRLFAGVDNLIMSDSFFQSLANNPELYFEKIKKDWDIDYQIHELGFKRIDILYAVVQKFMKDPGQYDVLLKNLLAQRKDSKDNYLIQLFNRVYLNYHPNPNPAYLKRYLFPRYVDGIMYNEPGHEQELEKALADIELKMNDEKYEGDLALLEQLKIYIWSFKEKYL